MKKISDILSKNFLFLEVKISTYLKRRVFVMSAIGFSAQSSILHIVFSYFVLFVILLMCLVDPVKHCWDIVETEEAFCFDFL